MMGALLTWRTHSGRGKGGGRSPADSALFADPASGGGDFDHRPRWKKITTLSRWTAFSEPSGGVRGLLRESECTIMIAAPAGGSPGNVSISLRKTCGRLFYDRAWRRDRALGLWFTRSSALSSTSPTTICSTEEGRRLTDCIIGSFLHSVGTEDTDGWLPLDEAVQTAAFCSSLLELGDNPHPVPKAASGHAGPKQVALWPRMALLRLIHSSLSANLRLDKNDPPRRRTDGEVSQAGWAGSGNDRMRGKVSQPEWSVCFHKRPVCLPRGGSGPRPAFPR